MAECVERLVHVYKRHFLKSHVDNRVLCSPVSDYLICEVADTVEGGIVFAVDRTVAEVKACCNSLHAYSLIVVNVKVRIVA